MKNKIFILTVLLTISIFATKYAQADEFGILSETVLYPDGLRLDTDSKLFIWKDGGVLTVNLSPDKDDKRERKESLKGIIPRKKWFGFGIIWDSNNDNNKDPKNMTAYANGSLKFWVKTETKLKVGIMRGNSGAKWKKLKDYGVLADNQWRFVSIPLDDFWGNDSKFANITQLFMVTQDGNPDKKDLTFHLDNVRWDTELVGELDRIAVSPSSWRIPTGLPKSFFAKGYDANGNIVDVYPIWSVSGVSGIFIKDEGPMGIFEPTSASGSGTITATQGTFSGNASVQVIAGALNDFFNVFIDEGLYGILGTYADTSSEIKKIGTVINEHPDDHKKSLEVAYEVTKDGWAGVFIQEGEQLLINSDVEIGSVVPLGWETLNNDLTNEEGWVKDEYHSPKYSLKIKNTTGANAAWRGSNVYLDEPYPTKLSFSGWAKADNVSAASEFRLTFYVQFQTGSTFRNLSFKKGTHGWESVQATYDFGRPVTRIRPLCVLYGGSGTAWFDDIYAQVETLKTEDLSIFDDGYLHFWVKTPVDLVIGLRSDNVDAGEERSKVLLSDYDIALDNRWHDVYIALDDFKIWDNRLDLSKMKVFFNAAVVGKEVGAVSGTFWLSDIRYVRRKEATVALSIDVKNRRPGQPEPNEITWSDVELGSEWKIANQYLEVTYDNPNPSWGVQIYTDNRGDYASPKYKGDPQKDLNQQPTGLIGERNRLINCPMAWMVLDDTNDNIPTPVDKPNNYPENHPRFARFFKSDTDGKWGQKKALNEWSWLKDVSSTKRRGDGGIVSDFSSTGDDYSTFVSTAGIRTGWRQDDETIFILNPKSPIVIYLAAKFKIARELQKYKTNTLTLELYHY